MDYLFHILVSVALFSILATSFNLLIGYSGLFALSHAAFFGVGAYATAILTTQLGLGFPSPLLIGMLITAFVGIAIALPALRIGGDYLVIVSLALQMIVAAIMLNWTSLTGGTDGIRGIPRVVIAGWELNSAPRFLPLAACCAAICFWISWKIGHSPYGRALKAMRENESAVLSVGKNVVAMKLSVFALAAALASVAGSLYAHYVTFVSAEGFTLDLTVYILAMVILGGTGNLWGSLLGAAILTALPELLKFLALAPDIADKTRQMLYGVILILILRIRPQGLIPESPTLTKAQDPGFRPDVGALVKAAKLEGKGLEKRFGGIVAVSGVDISIEPGRITGLIGPNGAGKTTAFNLLTGFLKPSAGEVRYRDRSLTGLKPHEIVRLGIARSFQDLRLFTRMSVIENVMVAMPRQSGDSLFQVFFNPWKVQREEREHLAKALAILEFVQLAHRASDIAADLSYAEEKLLVVARLMATEAEVLLFDEPLSGLSPDTLEQVFPIFRKLAASGRTLAIIEHNLDVIRSLCDSAIFLDEGKKFAHDRPEVLMNDPVLATRYFK